MPIKPFFGKNGGLVFVGGMFVVSTGFFLFAGGAYYNLYLAVAACVLLTICAVESSGVKRLCKSCVVPGRAVVMKIEESRNYTYLFLAYRVNGEKYISRVRFREREVPEVGRDVGIFFNPHNPGVCMLAIYKEHRMGWSFVDESNFKKGIVGLYVLGGIFFSLGLALLVVVNVESGDYTETARGTIVDYDSRYEYHNSNAPGTYEYTPVVEYELDGHVQRAKSVESGLLRTYDVGDVVEVRYAPDNPGVVIIEGFNSTIIGGSLMFAVGASLIGLGVWRTRTIDDAKRKLFGAGERIDFM